MRPQTLSGSSLLCPCFPCAGSVVLAVVLCREIFEGCKAIVAWHVLLELLLQGLETDAVLLVGAKLGDVEAGGVRHVDHVGIGQHRELILLREKDTGCEGVPQTFCNASVLYLYLQSNKVHHMTLQCGSQNQQTHTDTPNKPFIKVAFSSFYEWSTSF